MKGLAVNFLLVLLLSGCLELRNREPSYRLRNVGKATEVSVLSFNILASIDLKAQNEGYKPWAARKSTVLSILERYSADFIVVVEATSGQADDIRRHLFHDYHMIINENFTPDTLLLVKKSRFDVIEHGHWALEDPLFFARIRRVALWASVRERAGGREMMLVGVHLDAKTLKDQEFELLQKKLAKQEETAAPLFLAGDFNSGPDDPLYPRVIAGAWADSFAVHKASKSEGMTYPFLKPTRRIDHIFYHGKSVTPYHWEAITHANEPAYSDHKAVFARFTVAESS